jgi:hypothetical protein
MTSTNYCFSFWPTGWVTMERRSLSAPYRRTYVLTVRFRAVGCHTDSGPKLTEPVRLRSSRTGSEEGSLRQPSFAQAVEEPLAVIGNLEWKDFPDELGRKIGL